MAIKSSPCSNRSLATCWRYFVSVSLGICSLFFRDRSNCLVRSLLRLTMYSGPKVFRGRVWVPWIRSLIESQS